MALAADDKFSNFVAVLGSRIPEEIPLAAAEAQAVLDLNDGLIDAHWGRYTNKLRHQASALSRYMNESHGQAAASDNMGPLDSIGTYHLEADVTNFSKDQHLCERVLHRAPFLLGSPIYEQRGRPIASPSDSEAYTTSSELSIPNLGEISLGGGVGVLGEMAYPAEHDDQITISDYTNLVGRIGHFAYFSSGPVSGRSGRLRVAVNVDIGTPGSPFFILDNTGGRTYFVGIVIRLYFTVYSLSNPEPVNAGKVVLNVWETPRGTASSQDIIRSPQLAVDMNLAQGERAIYCELQARVHLYRTYGSYLSEDRTGLAAVDLRTDASHVDTTPIHPLFVGGGAIRIRSLDVEMCSAPL